jgi:hypothetical protein
MKPKARGSICLLLAGFMISGCASFEPGTRLQTLERPRQPTARAAQEGLEVSVEEFVNHEKSQTIFDTDLAASRVLAIFVRAENSGTEKYTLRRSDIKALLKGQPLTSLTPTEAADEAATSEYVGKALGWTVAAGPLAILLWPVTIGVSAIHTRRINKRIESYFESSGYQDALVGPKQIAKGFIYFKFDKGMDKLENLVIEAEATEDQSGKKLPFKFSLPPLDLPK